MLNPAVTLRIGVSGLLHPGHEINQNGCSDRNLTEGLNQFVSPLLQIAGCCLTADFSNGAFSVGLNSLLSFRRTVVFTISEAQAKIGRRVRLKVELDGVPADTSGLVTSAVHDNQQWFVKVIWDSDPPGLPQVRWFSKSEYTSYLTETSI
ncbi:MAG: hypothetical protein U0Z53_26470 [Blastocatellia bacterium]